MILSGTPCRFVANPRRKACQPCHSIPAAVSAGRMTSFANRSRQSGLSTELANIHPLSGEPHCLSVQLFGRHCDHWNRSLAGLGLRSFCMFTPYGSDHPKRRPVLHRLETPNRRALEDFSQHVAVAVFGYLAHSTRSRPVSLLKQVEPGQLLQPRRQASIVVGATPEIPNCER